MTDFFDKAWQNENDQTFVIMFLKLSMFVLWIFEKENKSTKVMLVIPVYIYFVCNLGLIDFLWIVQNVSIYVELGPEISK